MIDDTEERTPEEIEADAAPDNASNDLAVRRKRGKTKDREARENEALSYMLASPNGRLFLRTVIFTICGADSEIVNAAYDIGGTMYRAGARRVGLELQARCKAANASGFISLMTEEINGENT
jgi:hypothetical protein